MIQVHAVTGRTLTGDTMLDCSAVVLATLVDQPRSMTALYMWGRWDGAYEGGAEGGWGVCVPAG